MEGLASTPMDPTGVRFRMRSFVAGTWLSVGTAAVFIVYFLATLHDGHRGVLLAIALGALAASAGLRFLPMERVIRSRWREPFFTAWSGAVVALVALSASLDGGLRSPLIAGLFIPLCFGALSYPPATMLVMGVLVQAGFAAVAIADSAVHGSFAAFYSGMLAMATWMCAWQARNHEHQRGELQRVSRADPLTGCLNRRGLEDRLAADLARASRTGRPLALIVLDLDGFKETNDTRGHAAGDALLRWTVVTIDQTVRPMDAVGRIGGDEFAVVLPDAGRSEAVEIAERLRAAMAERAPASFGVAAFPADGTDADTLHHHADAELYASKRGRHGARDSGTPRELSWAAAMARAVDLRMARQHEHSHAVGELAVLIARRLGWEGDQLGHLRLAGMLHDVGKAAVPDAILRKPGPLEPEEREIVEAYPALSADMVARIDGLGAIAGWVGAAHEHLDGSGYPDGLQGEEIPLAARIILVADAYDAMTSDRVYRRAMSHDAAVAELRAHAGTQFDASCVEHLVTALQRGEAECVTFRAPRAA
jgi:diguanylate cyclase (GGDEF)-like protein